MVVVVLVSLVAVWALFRFTKLGLAMRAAALRPASASLSGIRVETMLAIGWGLAAVLGAVAGLMAEPSTAVTSSIRHSCSRSSCTHSPRPRSGPREPGGRRRRRRRDRRLPDPDHRLRPADRSNLLLPFTFAVILVILLVKPTGSSAAGRCSGYEAAPPDCRLARRRRGGARPCCRSSSAATTPISSRWWGSTSSPSSASTSSPATRARSRSATARSWRSAATRARSCRGTTTRISSSPWSSRSRSVSSPDCCSASRAAPLRRLSRARDVRPRDLDSATCRCSGRLPRRHRRRAVTTIKGNVWLYGVAWATARCSSCSRG